MIDVAFWTDWVARGMRLVPEHDRHVLLNPAALVYRFSKFALAHRAGIPEPSADDIRARDSELVTLILDLFRVLAKTYFRLEVDGIENLPAKGPVLLVGNHNGALLPTDGFFTALAIHDHFGRDRAMYALAHDFLFTDDVLRRFFLRLGLLRAGHDSARHVFDAGGIVLVYPGSDLETFRSFRDRKKVILGGRKGFLQLALSAGVPIVPVVSCGTHEQLVVLTRGDRLGRLVGMHKWARTDVMPIVLSLPWGLTSGFVPYLPLPAQTTLAFGEPLRFEAGSDPALLDRAYHEVEARMQRMLDQLEDDRTPWLGKRRRQR